MLFISFLYIRMIPLKLIPRSIQYFSYARFSTGFTLVQKIKIGDVSKPLKKSSFPELIPRGYYRGHLPQSSLHHLKWLLQKDVLGQDIFIIGRPGPQRRNLVLQYLELTGQEYEYLALTRDTTEADIKQRREIKQGTARFVNQEAVRAALAGRVLVLEGIEKAERNVLPILNNLLENREMHLDDGRFLVSPEKYEKLLLESSASELERMNLLPVSADFRVIALGLPVPKYRGHSLDPPLRSRFQSRHVKELSFKNQYEHLFLRYSKAPTEKLSQLLSFAYGLLAEESQSLSLPEFPVNSLDTAAALLEANPKMTSFDVLQLVYPVQMLVKQENMETLRTALKAFEISESSDANQGPLSTIKNMFKSVPSSEVSRRQITGIVPSSENPFMASVEMTQGYDESVTVSVPSHLASLASGGEAVGYSSTATHERMLADMMCSHAVSDFCIVGPKGSGKSMLVEKFASLLGYQPVPIMLYQDMTSREIVQQRRMLPSGDTIWQLGALLEAAVNGQLAILDGLHRLHHSTLAVLQRLIHDREIQLFDGSRYIAQSRFDIIKSETKLTDKELHARNIHAIHPAFRIVALAEPPNISDQAQQWLLPEVLPLFLFHELKNLPEIEEFNILHNKFSNVPPAKIRAVINLTERLRDSPDPNMQSLGNTMSLRQMTRIVRHLDHYANDSPRGLIDKICMNRFLPNLTKLSLNRIIAESDFGVTEEGEKALEAIECNVENGTLTIGDVSMPLFQQTSAALVPDIVFYDNQEHLKIMQDMMKDYLLGEHLLLMGNQGVGKNKIIDRFLQLLNRPRQYIQLHRDTTVQTLTLQSTVIDGVLVYEDSPLVKAVKHGHMLVIDEGDKAPTHVTCILKSLLESGDMRLADGRRIVGKNSHESCGSPNIIRMHQDFRVVVLANRPGFPFLGNDFYSALGDIFACHAVDNPSMESELAMLQKYGPSVPFDSLKKLAGAFSELRGMADEGLINYPYSTRELVNIVKHLQKFPDEGLPAVIRNVFDFDSFVKESFETVAQIMQKHGIPMQTSEPNFDIKLAQAFSLPQIQQLGVLSSGNTLSDIRDLVRTDRVLELQGPHKILTSQLELKKVSNRVETFTEQLSSWQLPISEMNLVCDIATEGTKDIFVSRVAPPGIFHFKPDWRHVKLFDLYDQFPIIRGTYRPRIRLGVLGTSSDPLSSIVALHEEMTNRLLILNPNDNTSSYVDSTFPMSKLADGEIHWRMLPNASAENVVFLFERNGFKLERLDFASGQQSAATIPDDLKIDECFVASPNKLLMKCRNRTDDVSNWFTVAFDSDKTVMKAVDYQASLDDDFEASSFGLSSMPDMLLSHCLNSQIESPNRLFTDTKAYAGVTVGFPELQSGDCHVYPRGTEGKSVNMSLPFWVNQKAQTFVHSGSKSCVLPKSGLLVNAVPSWEVPERAVDREIGLASVSGFLETVDLQSQAVSYVPVPGPLKLTANTPWMNSLMYSLFTLAPWGTEGVVTLDAGGGVRVWETSMASVRNSVAAWEKAMGLHDSKLSLTLEGDERFKESTADIDINELGGPKHGTMDPTGAPHHGGNTFAGGSGGRDTAGMGGVGGPYRLDLGHEVHQVPDSVKEQVPEHIRKKAREMAAKAYKQRLKEIQMSEHDAELYHKFLSKVEKQIGGIRQILDSLQAKAKERQWVRHQTSGDLDEGKLIEGITGEKTIFRKRAAKEPEPGTPQQKPKRLRICPDLSGSMYRFNGYDGRLQRTLEASLMVMEALKGYEERFKYDIVGHSGDTEKAEFVKPGLPPKNEKEQLQVLKMMLAHSQYCYSGDNTFEAAISAVKDLANEEADEHFVVLLSDANFERYGLSPKQFSEIMTSDSRVNVFTILIGSIGEQAERLKARLPTGRAFICRDTDEVPKILKDIFTSSLLHSSVTSEED